jgi:rhodanese-related sulfurtransferase
MNIKHLTFILSTAAILVSVPGCTGNKAEKKTETESKVSPEPTKVPVASIGNETLLLLKDLEENGDYVNSQQFPSLIKPSIVFEELGQKNLVVDLRSSKAFAEGHIKGAVNKQLIDLPEYFEAGIKPFEYDKIIMVCDDGQLSSYTTALLRLKGYANVFAMRWGMSGWNKKYADAVWFRGLSAKYESMLETTVNEMPQAKSMPELGTGLTTGREIGEKRFKQLFDQESENIMISADEVFADPAKYFVINFERKDKYDDGHIPGAVRYKPEATLGFSGIMATIPYDRTVVVYCGTGHNSAFATAFLRLFGYDARTLKYGNNSFMHDKMVKERQALSWLPFSMADVNDFPVVK